MAISFIIFFHLCCVLVECLALCCGLDHPGTNDEIAKPLAIVPLQRVAFDQRTQDFQDFVLVQVGSIKLAKTLSVVAWDGS